MPRYFSKPNQSIHGVDQPHTAWATLLNFVKNRPAILSEIKWLHADHNNIPIYFFTERILEKSRSEKHLLL